MHNIVVGLLINKIREETMSADQANKHFIMTDKGGQSFLETQSAPVFEEADYEGWEALSIETAGLFFFMFKVQPNAEDFPLHASPDDWISYVISGHGKLFAGIADGPKTEQVEFKAGDFISFKPNTQHAWENGSSETKLLFLKVS